MNDMRKLMEAVQLDEYERTEPVYTEYRDPDGEFIVKYRASRGYYAEGDGVDRAPSFENLDDAIEHGELCISSGFDDALEEEGDIGYGDSLGNVSQLTAELLAKHDENVSKILTSKFHGKTVELNVLGRHGGSRMTGWGPVRVEIERVSYQAHDVNGPVYISTDGKEYQSHPDHDVQ